MIKVFTFITVLLLSTLWLPSFFSDCYNIYVAEHHVNLLYYFIVSCSIIMCQHFATLYCLVIHKFYWVFAVITLSFIYLKEHVSVLHKTVEALCLLIYTVECSKLACLFPLHSHVFKKFFLINFSYNIFSCLIIKVFKSS